MRPLLRDFERKIAMVTAPLVNLSTRRALLTLRETRPTLPIARSRFREDLPAVVRAFIAMCEEASPEGGFLVDRGAGADEAGHAIGVAAITARLTGILGLPAQEQTMIVSAALLHDVGLIFVPAAVRAKPHSQRSIPERIRFEDHAILGEALLEPFGTPSLHLSIVAGEHHERVDGSGYPRGRAGGHRLLRTAEDKRDVERMTLASEIVAVADVYERLIAPGPGYEGRSPAAARAVMEEAAGRTLNRDIVHRFLESFPVLPAGTEVIVDHGPYEGMRGLVSVLRPGGEDDPVVRLFLDADGRQLDEAIEVDLARDRTTGVVLAETAVAEFVRRRRSSGRVPAAR